MDLSEGGRMSLYWDLIESPFATTFAAWVDEEGKLIRFNLNSKGAARQYKDAERNSKKLGEVRRQVHEYAKGKRRDFELALEPEGPEFNKRVWEALLDIPFGTTTH